MRPFYTKLVGVTFPNDDGSSRQKIIASLSAGDVLHLVDMASEEYPEAIGVFNARNQQCGHLRREFALSLRMHYQDFESLSVHVVDVTGGDGMNYGCNIEITATDANEKQRSSKKEESTKIVTTLVKTTGKDMYGSSIQENIASLSVGDELCLFDNSNYGEPGSISVCQTGTEAECGYLPKSVATKLRNMKDVDFEDFPVNVVEITENESGKYSCIVEIETNLDYVCQILLKKDGSLYIKTPLDNISPSVFPSLSVGEHLLVKDTPGQQFISVHQQDQSFVGNLPESATEQMRKRRLNLPEVQVVISILRMDDDEPYCNVIVETGAPAAQPSSGNVPVDPPRAQTADPAKPPVIESPTHTPVSPASTGKAASPASEKNTNAKKSKGGCLTFILFLFVAFLIFSNVF